MTRKTKLVQEQQPAFRTIGEISAIVGVPAHVLRFWEARLQHLRPLRRSNGRRFYSPDDLDLIRGIHRSVYSDGQTLRGVMRIIKERGVDEMRKIGRGEASAAHAAQGLPEVKLPPAANMLPAERLRALVAALSCPEGCRSLAQASVGLGF